MIGKTDLIEAILCLMPRVTKMRPAPPYYNAEPLPIPGDKTTQRRPRALGGDGGLTQPATPHRHLQPH